MQDKRADRADLAGDVPVFPEQEQHPRCTVSECQTGGMENRAGTVALPEDLVDVEALVRAYYELKPDVSIPEQKVVFGTSGHRGSSLNTAFNEDHIAATTQAIVEYRASQGITGPLFSSPTACACSSTRATASHRRPP
jgi:hypothetical protein